MPVVVAGSEEQKKKYLGRMVEEPLMSVSEILAKLLNFLWDVFLAFFRGRAKISTFYFNVASTILHNTVLAMTYST